MQEKIYTYSENFFMTAFFTLRARGVSTTVLVAGGGVTPASGAVPATAMVTVPIVVVSGSVPTSWRMGSGEQGKNFIPGGFDYMCFPFAHNPTTLRDRRQSFGQLHGWCGGVVPSRLPLGFPFRRGVPAFRGFAAGQSLGCLSSLCFGCGAGEKVVRSRDVGLWRIALVQLCVSLQKIFS
jgi:hypothetical protein